MTMTSRKYGMTVRSIRVMPYTGGGKGSKFSHLDLMLREKPSPSIDLGQLTFFPHSMHIDSTS